MKKFITIILLILAGTISANLYAQSTQTDSRTDKKAAKKEKRAQEKAQEKAMKQLAYQKAVQALNEQSFVLEPNQLMCKRGQTTFLTPSTNFVQMNGQRATVQVAFNTAMAGPNGIGGITVEGNVSDIKSSTDKKGNVNYSFNIQGTGVSAQVSISLPNGSNNATVNVYPNFNSQTLTLNGTLVPREESTVFKGRSL